MKNRPFAVIGVSSFVAAVFLVYKSIFTVSVIGAISLAVFLLSLLLFSCRSQYLTLAFVSFGVCIASISLLFTMKNYVRITNVYEGDAKIYGTVTDVNSYEDYERVTIKVSEINRCKESFNITVFNSSGQSLSVGEVVFASADLKIPNVTQKNIIYGIGNKTYFEVKELKSCEIVSENSLIKFFSRVKTTYISVLDEYLPKEIGSVAAGMTIGDKSDMSKYLRNSFNYSGTAHLLVVSGLHLALWTTIISNFIPIFRRKKVLNFIIVSAFIFCYLMLTGFSVSVVRAGVMIFIVYLAKCLGKGADSINSLGLAVFMILVKNAFAVTSVSFWLSAASTLGIVLFSGKTGKWIFSSKFGKAFSKSFLSRAVVDAVDISFSVTVLTLPVFILFLQLFPVLSFFSNMLISSLASALMVLSVFAVAVHLCGLLPLARCMFYFVGIITKIIIAAAEKIGMLRYSTVAVSSRFFKGFVIITVLITAAFFIIRKFLNIKHKYLLQILSLLLVITVLLSEGFELSHPSVDVVMTSGSSVILLRDGYDTVLAGIRESGNCYSAEGVLGRHNQKKIGCLYAADGDRFTTREIMKITDEYPISSLAFKEDDFLSLKDTKIYENISSVTLNGVLSIESLSENSFAVTNGKENILISSEKTNKNLFQNERSYDIIILNKSASEDFIKEAERRLKNSTSQILLLNDGETITIYPDIRKIYFSESF